VKDFTHILELIWVETTVMLTLSGAIFIPAKADVKSLRRLLVLSVAIKNVVMLVLGHDDIGSS